MTLHLYHGPFSAKKEDVFWQLVQKCHGSSQPDYLIMAPHAQAAVSLKNRLVQKMPSHIFLGTPVVTWDDFCLALIKKTRSRVHKASTLLCQQIVFLCATEIAPALLPSLGDTRQATANIQRFFVNLKSAGFTPELAKKNFQNLWSLPGLFDVFSAYQKKLQSIFHVDVGDLFLNTLTILADTKVTVTLPQQIFLKGLYPLGPGHRQILSLMRNRFPQTQVHIFYDEFFNRDDDILSLIYQELGQISDANTHIENPEPKDICLNTYPDPFFEIKQTGQDLALALEKKQNPHHWGIVLLNSDYAEPLERELQVRLLPYASHFAPKLSDVIAKIGTHEFGFLRELSPEFKNALVAQTHAGMALEDRLAELSFNATLLSEEIARMPQEPWEDFLNSLLTQTRLNTTNFAESILITDLATARQMPERHWHVLGCTLENVASQRENRVTQSLSHLPRDLSEILENPAKDLAINLTGLENLLGGFPELCISKSQQDFYGSATLDIPWKNLTVWVQKRIPIVETQNLRGKTDYFKTKKHHFSVSEIEDYLKCPFKYYATHHLKLKKNPEDDLEPTSEAKGSLVHRVLQRLLQENDKEYREGLEYETYRQRLIKKLAPLIAEEIIKDERFQNKDKTLIDFYAYRVFKTITEVLRREAESFKNKAKRTVPQYFEWSFGENFQRPLEINTPEGKVILNGRVDRIDVHHSSKNFTVIDYKTGEPDSVADIKAGRSIQLPLYLMACQQYLYKNYQPSGAFYYTLKENEVKGFSLANSADAGIVSERAQIDLEEWQTIVQKAIDVVVATVGRIRAGQFEPAPQKEHICSYCEFRNLCGYRFRRGEVPSPE